MPASTMHPIQIQDIASWKNNPRLSIGRGTKVSQPRNVLKATDTGTPIPVTAQSATNSGGKVTVSHVVSSSDTTYSHVDIWASGYLGNTTPVKVSSGTSPHTFFLQPTGETVSLHFQSIGKDGSSLPLNQAPSATVKL